MGMIRCELLKHPAIRYDSARFARMKQLISNGKTEPLLLYLLELELNTAKAK